MRLRDAVALGSLLVSAMGAMDIERALALARARDAERQQFHARYIFDLKDPVVTRLEVTTEFRRLELIAEEHVLRGDWMFTRSVRAAQEALAPTRGLINIHAQVRFNPLNTFVQSPPYAIAMSAVPGGRLDALDTQITPEFSTPFQTKDRKTLTAIIGASIDAKIAAAPVGQTTQTVGVTLDGRPIAQTAIDFSRLD